MPALEKTRLLGRKVAICSMRNSCNQDLTRIEARIRDFDMIWLDDHVSEVVVPRMQWVKNEETMRTVEDQLVELATQVSNNRSLNDEMV